MMREMTITFSSGKYLKVDDYEDMEDIEKAIKEKEKFIYLYNTHYWINLDLVSCIGVGCDREVQ